MKITLSLDKQNKNDKCPHGYPTAHRSYCRDCENDDEISELKSIISQQTAEIERLIEVMDRASDMLSHNNESYKILQSALLTTIQGVDNT